MDTSRELNEALYTYTLVRDVISGEPAVKRKDELYLPMPSGMVGARNPSIGRNDDNATIEYNPNYSHNPAYMAYKTRASMPDIAGFALRSMIGIALSKPGEVDLPIDIDMGSLYKDALSEVLQVGRYGQLLDIHNGELTIHNYVAESILSYIEHDGFLSEVTLSESIQISATESVYNTRRLLLVDDVYTSELYDEDDNLIGDVITPMLSGRTLDFIPFVFLGSTNNKAQADISPMAGMCQLAVQIYMKSADLSQAEYTSCNPTLIFSGVSGEDAPTTIGSTVALALPDPASKAYYTVTDTGALDHVQRHIKELYEQAVMFSVQMLSPSAGVESGDALRIRHGSATSSLVTVIRSIANGYGLLFDMASTWSGINREQFVFEPETELATAQINAQEMVALVNSWMQGIVSRETVIDIFRRAGLLAGDRSVDEELAAIAAEPPA